MELNWRYFTIFQAMCRCSGKHTSLQPFAKEESLHVTQRDNKLCRNLTLRQFPSKC